MEVTEEPGARDNVGGGKDGDGDGERAWGREGREERGERGEGVGAVGRCEFTLHEVLSGQAR